MSIFNKKYFKLISLIILPIIVFYPSLYGQFLNWDDTTYITLNRLMENDISFSSFFKLYDFDNNISLVLFSFLVQIKLFGLNSFSFHSFNLAFHIINVILIYRLSDLLLKNKNYAFFIAIIFAIHPLKVETVAWVIQRKDILFTFFALTSIITYIKYLRHNNTFILIAVFALGYASSLCKIQSIALPFSLLLIEFFINKKISKKSIIFNCILIISLLTNIYEVSKIVYIIFIPFLIITNKEILVVKIKNLKSYILEKVNRNKKLNIETSHTIFNLGLALSTLVVITYFLKYFLNNFPIDASTTKFISDTTAWVLTLTILTFIISSIIIILDNKASANSSKSKLFFNTKLNSLVSKTKEYLRKFDTTIILIVALIFILFFNAIGTVITKEPSSIPFGFKNNVLYTLISISLLLFYKYFNSQIPIKKSYKLILTTAISAISIFALVILNKGSFFIDAAYSLWERILMGSYSFIYYLLKFFYPFKLNAMHPYPESGISLISNLWIYFALCLIIIAGSAYTIYKIKNKVLKNEVIFGLLFFIIQISVVLHLIPIKGRVIVADRYTYLAYFGLIFTVFSIIKYMQEKYQFKNIKLKLLQALSIIIIATFSYQSYNRSRIWENDLSFWTDISAKDPSNHYAFYSLGLYYYQQGDFANAITNYSTAIEQHQSDFEYYSNRAACYVQTRSTNLALEDFSLSLSLNPKNYAAYYNRAILLFNSGDIINSHKDLEMAVKTNSKYTEAISKLNQVTPLYTALEEYNIDSSQNRDLSEYYNKFGVDYAMMNNMYEALEYFNLAVQYDTINISALQNRGNVYAAIKNFESAKQDLFKILEISPNEGGAYLNLANIFHESGDPKTACEYWHKSLNMGMQDAQIMINKFCN